MGVGEVGGWVGDGGVGRTKKGGVGSGVTVQPPPRCDLPLVHRSACLDADAHVFFAISQTWQQQSCTRRVAVEMVPSCRRSRMH